MSAPDLSTRWLGFELPHPLVASSSPLTGDLASLRELEQAGVAAVVLPSLFQEQVEHDATLRMALHHTGMDSTPEASGYFPVGAVGATGPHATLELVESARDALAVPVVASLNGLTDDGWAKYATRLADAGAQAIELNLLTVPVDPDVSADDVERRMAEEVAAVVGAVSVPVTVKLAPACTAPVHLARRLVLAGARGLSVFNRFPEPDIDLETLEVVPRLEASRPSELRAVLRWTALLSPHVDVSLAATTGVHAPDDVVKLLLAGADVVMSASALLQRGAGQIGVLVDGLRRWLADHEYASVEQMKGSMNHAHCPEPRGFERLNYMRAVAVTATPEGFG